MKSPLTVFTGIGSTTAHRRFLQLLILLLAVVSVSPVYAQSLAQTEPLTLDEAISYALKQSPRLAGKRQGVVTKKEAVATAKAKRLPKVDFDTAYRVTNQRVQSALGFPLTDLSDIPEEQPFAHEHLNAGVFATFPLYTGDRIGSGIRRAQAEQDEAGASEQDVKSQVIFDVTESYARLVQLGRDIQAAEESVNALTESLRDMEAKLKTGKAARVDLLKIDARLADVRANLIRFRNARDIEASLLNALIGRPVDTPVVVKTELQQPEAVALLNSTAVINSEGNTRYKLARARVATVKRQVDTARSRLYPSLSLVAGYREQVIDPNHGPYKGDAIAGVVLSMPLFDSTLSHGVEEEKSRELERSYEMEQARLDAEQEIRTASLQIRDAQERIQATQAAIASAREVLRIEQLEERLGRSMVENLLDAQAALLTAEANYYRALADYTIAVAGYKRQTGKNLSEFSK